MSTELMEITYTPETSTDHESSRSERGGTTEQAPVPVSTTMLNWVEKYLHVEKSTFQRKVNERIHKSPMGIQEAEIEVFLDEYIREKGNKDKALFYLVSEENNEKEVQKLITSLLHRGANPNAKGEIRENERDDNRSTDTENENECTHTKGCTVLYHAVKNNYRSVCATLLEHEALADVRSYDPKSKAMELPLKIAYNTKQDDIAALLIKYMSNEFVRNIHIAQGDTDAEFILHDLLPKKMPKTLLAVLDCMKDDNKGKTRVYFNVLETDSSGRLPCDKRFKLQSSTGFHIIAKDGNKNIVNHDVFRMFVRSKWLKFARDRFIINSLINVFTLITITISAVVASTTTDPAVYDLSAKHIGRAICELFSLGMMLFTLTTEINQMRRRRLEYVKYASNWIDVLSSLMLFLLLPLRFTTRNAQWFVFSAAYFLWTVRVMKYATVFRHTGAYILMLWRIFVHDIVRFASIFVFILFAFSGCLLLSLRGEDSLEKFMETSSFTYILFVGIRILIEAERIVEYTEFQPVSTIIMVAFLFTLCVLMLNILIAQVSDTYKNVKEDVHREFEVNRASIVARVELNSIFTNKYHRLIHYEEYEEFEDVTVVLKKWKYPPLHEMNTNIQCIREDIDTQEMNMRTVRNRLSRLESHVFKIRSSLENSRAITLRE